MFGYCLFPIPYSPLPSYCLFPGPYSPLLSLCLIPYALLIAYSISPATFPYPLFPVYHSLVPIACFPPYPLPPPPNAKSFFAFHEQHIRQTLSTLAVVSLS